MNFWKHQKAHPPGGLLDVYQGPKPPLLKKVAFHSNKIQHYAQDLEDPAPLSAAFRQQAYTTIWSGKYVEAEDLAQQSLALGLKAGLPLDISGGYQILS
jgi:hypothetical protein